MTRTANQHRLQQQILEAAALLVRRDGGDGFSMRALADVAGVGLVTPYNIFGSKGAVLMALFERAVDELEARAARGRARSPITRVIAVMRAVAELYTSDSAYYRPLLKALLASGEPINRLFARSLAAFSEALDGATTDGTLVAGVETAFVARELVIVCTGVLELWVHEEIDDEGCSAQMLFSALLCLRAVVDEPHARALVQQIRTAQLAVPPELSSARPVVVGTLRGKPASRARARG